MRVAVQKLLSRIDPQTRGSVRQIESIDIVTYGDWYGITRADSIVAPDSMAFGWVNFADSAGFGLIVPPHDKYDDVFNPDPLNPEPSDPTDILSDYTVLFLTNEGAVRTDDLSAYINNSSNTSGTTSYFPSMTDEEASLEFTTNIVMRYMNGEFTVDGGYIENPGYSPTWTETGPLLKTKRWHQYSPFNDKIHCYNNNEDRRPAGCTTIATAQLLTYFKDKSPSRFGINDEDAWNYIERVTELPNPSDSLTVAKDYTSTFVKSVADGIGVEYNFLGSGGTFATPVAANSYLRSLGYNSYKYLGYTTGDENRVIRSINKNRPVLMSALCVSLRGLSKFLSGHTWVVDGYISSSVHSHYFVHCSYGWGGRSDGWYYYKIFNSENNNNYLLDAYLDSENVSGLTSAQIDEFLRDSEEPFEYNAFFRTVVIED